MADNEGNKESKISAPEPGSPFSSYLGQMLGKDGARNGKSGKNLADLVVGDEDVGSNYMNNSKRVLRALAKIGFDGIKDRYDAKKIMEITKIPRAAESIDALAILNYTIFREKRRFFKKENIPKIEEEDIGIIRDIAMHDPIGYANVARRFHDDFYFGCSNTSTEQAALILEASRTKNADLALQALKTADYSFLKNHERIKIDDADLEYIEEIAPHWLEFQRMAQYLKKAFTYGGIWSDKKQAEYMLTLAKTKGETHRSAARAIGFLARSGYALHGSFKKPRMAIRENLLTEEDVDVIKTCIEDVDKRQILKIRSDSLKEP